MNIFERWIISIIPTYLAREKLGYLFDAQRELLCMRSETENELRNQISMLQASKRSVHERIKLMDGDEGNDIPYEDLKADNMIQRNRIVSLDKLIADLQRTNRENFKAFKELNGRVPVVGKKATPVKKAKKKPIVYGGKEEEKPLMWTEEERRAIQLATIKRTAEKRRSKRKSRQ